MAIVQEKKQVAAKNVVEKARLKAQLDDSHKKAKRLEKKVKLFQSRDERVQALRRDISRAEGRVKELTDEVKKLTEERDNALRRFGLCV